MTVIDPRRLRVLVWNVYVGQRPTRVRAGLLFLVALTWPHVIALQEGKRFRGSLPGYRRHAADDHPRPDANNCVVLVRRGLTQSGEPVPVDGPGWVHKRPKPSRVFYLVRVAWLTVIDLHRCTAGMTGSNRAEWIAETAALETAARGHDPLALVGDWNAHPDRRGTLAPAALAREIPRAEIVASDEDTIDYAIVAGAHSTARRFPFRLGSDHRPWLLTVWRP